MFLIDDLLFAPISGFKFVMRTIGRIAEEQYTDDAPLKEQLLELQVKLEQGDITEDEYVEQERDILQRLRDIQNYKMQQAGYEPEEVRGPLTSEGASFSIEVRNDDEPKR
jgi:hypothetical protein